MYYPCSKNEDADQLCSYFTADPGLCFRLCMMLVSLCGSSLYSIIILHKIPPTTCTKFLLSSLLSPLSSPNILFKFTDILTDFKNATLALLILIQNTGFFRKIFVELKSTISLLNFNTKKEMQVSVINVI